MKLDNTKRYYYHITERYWPKQKKLYPKNDGGNRAWNEPNTSRICVSPSISHCLVALHPYILKVYRTKSKVKAYYSSRVLDSKITEERWITKPTVFIKIGEIKKELLKDYKEETVANNYGYGDGEKQTMNFQRKWLKHFQKIEKDLI